MQTDFFNCTRPEETGCQISETSSGSEKQMIQKEEGKHFHNTGYASLCKKLRTIIIMLHDSITYTYSTSQLIRYLCTSGAFMKEIISYSTSLFSEKKTNKLTVTSSQLGKSKTLSVNNRLINPMQLKNKLTGEYGTSLFYRTPLLYFYELSK